MKKLRLTANEWKEMLKDISITYHEDCHKNLNEFEYTKKNVDKFIKELMKEEVIKPILMIDNDAYIKMYELVNQSSVEIQWHMLVTRDLKHQLYEVKDILLFPQTNTGTSTTTDQKEFTKWQMELIKDPEFPLEELRGHGHSHVNMNVYSSGIDDAYQRDLITKVQDGDYYVFLILNKKMEMYALIYDFSQQILFENSDIDVQILDADGRNIKAWCKEQIEQNCQTKQYAKPTYYKPASTLKIDSYSPPEEELISTMTQAIRKLGRRK